MTERRGATEARRDRVAVIHQPDFLPYLGFFQRLLQADLYVVLDNVQFLRGSRRWHNRDKIKTAHGEKWITVDVKKAPRGIPLNEVVLADTDWRERNLNAISAGYRDAPFFGEIFPPVAALFALGCTRLVDFTMASISMLQGLFGIEIESVTASSLHPVGKGNELLVDILQKTGARRYLSGIGAKAYFDPAPFERAGISVLWQQFAHPVYPQLHGAFIPYLSSVDLLFNCGAAEGTKILGRC